MEEIVTNAVMENRVCKKRPSESNPPDSATCHDPMFPITPHSKSENFILGSNNSPNDVFDRFSPGPDCLNFAPHCSQLKSNLSVARTLRFDLDTNIVGLSKDVVDYDDEIVLESVYSSVMEVIMLNQIKENDEGLGDINCAYGFETPIRPRVSGVGDTCPGAPVKSSKRRRIIDNKICRKLQF